MLPDFQLGRLNCRSFLAKSFLLYASNPLFAPWAANLQSPTLRPFLVEGDDPENPGRKRLYLPIIPLVGSADAPIPAPAWPELSAFELDDVMARDRATFVPGLLAGWVVRAAWLATRGSLLPAIRRFVEADLRRHSLLR